MMPGARVSRFRLAFRVTVAAVLVIPAGGWLGCRRGPPQASTSELPPGSVRDEIGRVVTPRALPARRVVSLAPNVTELMFAIGAGGQLVGLDKYSDQPAAEVDRLPRVGSNYEPSLERIAGLAPDLVFLSKSANKRETAEALERMGIPTFLTETPGLAEMGRTLRDVGRLTGHLPEAERFLARMEAGFAAVRERTRALPRPRVLVAVWTQPLYVGGRGTFAHDLIELAGGENVAREVEGFVTFPMERLLHLAPEVIILPTHAPETGAAPAVAAWKRWPTLPAVKDGRVFAVEDSLISRPGARLVQGAELLARLIHPEPSPARDRDSGQIR